MLRMATFDTQDYGRIEVKLCSSQDWKGVAYFFAQDFETEVSKDGEFCDVNGLPFRVLWPLRPEGMASLDVVRPREIGRVQPTVIPRINVYA